MPVIPIQTFSNVGIQHMYTLMFRSSNFAKENISVLKHNIQTLLREYIFHGVLTYFSTTHTHVYNEQRDQNKSENYNCSSVSSPFSVCRDTATHYDYDIKYSLLA